MSQSVREEVAEHIDDAVHFFNQAENTPSETTEALLASLQGIASSQIAIAKMMALKM